MYFLFAGENFYPVGGLDDLKGSFASVEDALRYLADAGQTFETFDWYQIATVVDGRLVAVEG
jgi:hypothetical protein